MLDGELELSNAQGSVLVRGGEAAEVVPGGVPRKTAVLNAINAIQWCLYYPGILDPDYGVRQIFFGTSTVPRATWKAAELLGARIAREPRESLRPRWINYYGPRDSFSSVSIAQALEPGDVPESYFKDKIVLIGGRSTVGYLGTSRDEFATPYARISRRFSPGVEVHARFCFNILHGEWLRRMSPPLEMALVLVVGLAAGALGFLRPGFAALVAGLIALGIIGSAWALVWGDLVWFAWLVPLGIQLPVGFVWSVGAQYLLEARRRKELRKAFGFYLSPEMADKIADSDFDLRPGGKLVDVTVIFTDLENFTGISENLDPRRSRRFSPPISARPCPTCGSTTSVNGGDCLSCLLRAGLESGEDKDEEFEAVLAEADVPDTGGGSAVT